ncbi:hypothetical protein K503DRAFT_799510 [Rhizopogon vinicolor AM-OR11-026]|uniref:Nitrogen regulatory protein areA GATA-like domain-containing protein n=1 Tax=Rhizopogon vinicolor AM-OR11-026 TaxID=1314800 RepID=A0A1B7N453_9AGAM|nr:hypothetical protein K503DRAFT_799510 [Rhizopogon vinicolor AM-OR11-026]
MANYLPVLLGSVSAMPDDTAVSDLPRGQVDYLSHEWREEDVWRSWRNMTRLKNEIANGIRLENASWRTWWKQRNNLSTVSPETLNWLKDSDVTWLYGPLHTADYPAPTPTPKPSPNTAAALDLPMISSSPPPTKPILKHRSIMELLTSDLPSSPMFSPPDSDEDEVFHVHSDHEPPKHLTGPGVAGIIKRPPLMHTKSDTHISRLGPNRAFRRDSPPRIIPSGTQLASEKPPISPQGSSSDAVIVPGQKRKHISFNTFVEQCIAIEKPKKKRTMWNVEYPNSKAVDSSGYGEGYSVEDDGYDEDSEDGIIDEADELLFGDEDDRPHSQSHPHASYSPSASSHPSHPRSSPPPQNTSPLSSSTSEEEDEDEVLEMRVRHPSTAPSLPARSSSHSSSSTSSSSSRSRPPKARSASYSHSTNVNGSPLHRRRPSASALMRTCSTDKELITIALIAPTTLKTRAEEDEYPYVHSHSYPHPPTSDKWYSYCAQDSPVELVYVPRSYISDDRDAGADHRAIEADPYHRSLQPGRFFDHPLVASPSPQQDVPIKEETRAYFEQHKCAEPEGGHVLRCAQDGVTTSVPVARNMGGPEVVVDTPVECTSRSRSRSRSRSKSHSRSRSRTPSPALISVQMPPPSTAASVPRTNSSHPPSSSGLLQPPDAGMSRGRSVSSPTLSSQTEVPQTRGRSITRTSSYSDRDSEGADSPMGSLSPDGAFGLSIGIGSVYAGGRSDREREGVSRLGERGRERAGRRTESGSSLSPEQQRPSAVVTLPPPEPKNKRTSSSSSDSSTISAISVCTTRQSPRLVVDTERNTRADLTEAVSAAIPTSPNQVQTIDEEQDRISRQPTPANSPILAMRSRLPSPKPSSPASSSRHERKPSSGMSRSPTRGEDRQGGTLVGRAVEIMSNAGAFIGSFWHTGAQASVTAP